MADGDLTTLDAVKAWLPDMANVRASDDLLQSLITAASRFVCNYTGRPAFDLLSYSEDYDGCGHSYMLLRQWPAVAVQSIGFCSTTRTDPTSFKLESALTAGGNQRLSLATGVFPRGRGNVAIAYQAGYADIPADVAQATVELVGERFRTRDRIGQTAKTLGGQETTAFSLAAMSPAVEAMLAPYRRSIPC